MKGIQLIKHKQMLFDTLKSLVIAVTCNWHKLGTHVHFRTIASSLETLSNLCTCCRVPLQTKNPTILFNVGPKIRKEEWWVYKYDKRVAFKAKINHLASGMCLMCCVSFEEIYNDVNKLWILLLLFFAYNIIIFVVLLLCRLFFDIRPMWSTEKYFYIYSYRILVKITIIERTFYPEEHIYFDV